MLRHSWNIECWFSNTLLTVLIVGQQNDEQMSLEEKSAVRQQQTVTYSKSECIPPIRENMRTSAEVERMFNSHLWKLDKAETQPGGSGVLIRMSCTRCRADKIAILQQDES